MAEEEIKQIAKNKKAFHNYTVEDTLECGIELCGTEVKAIKQGRLSFTDTYARIRNNEIWVYNLHISPYPMGTHEQHEPLRVKKLLAHKHEIKRLKRKVDEKGFTLVPLRFYIKYGLIKAELGLCKGRKVYDKKEAIKRRDIKRDMNREMKERFK